MTKKHIAYIVMSLLFSNCGLFFKGNSAIPKIKRDKNFKYSWREFTQAASINSPNWDTAAIELRVYWENWGNGVHKMAHIIQNKHGDWTAKGYEFMFYNDEHKDLINIRKIPISIKKTWTSNWQSICSENLLNTKTQEAVDKIYRKKLQEIIVVADGKSVTIEVANVKAKRRIDYSNAATMYQNYVRQNIEIKAYQDFLRLDSILTMEFRHTIQ